MIFPELDSLYMNVYWQVVFPLDGRTWAMAESIEAGELEAVSSPNPLPPTVVSQHAQPPRRLILLTTQVCTVHSTKCDSVWLSETVSAGWAISPGSLLTSCTETPVEPLPLPLLFHFRTPTVIAGWAISPGSLLTSCTEIPVEPLPLPTSYRAATSLRSWGQWTSSSHCWRQPEKEKERLSRVSSGYTRCILTCPLLCDNPLTYQFANFNARQNNWLYGTAQYTCISQIRN